MLALRVTIGAIGTMLLFVGLFFFVQLDLSDMVSAAIWLVGGLVAHDVILAPVVVVLGVLGAMFLPTWAKAPVAVGGIVLFSVSLTAVPTIGKFGERPTDPWLLDKPYVEYWLGFVVLVTLGVLVGSFVARRRSGSTPDPSG